MQHGFHCLCLGPGNLSRPRLRNHLLAIPLLCRLAKVCFLTTPPISFNSEPPPVGARCGCRTSTQNLHAVVCCVISQDPRGIMEGLGPFVADAAALYDSMGCKAATAPPKKVRDAIGDGCYHFPSQSLWPLLCRNWIRALPT